MDQPTFLATDDGTRLAYRLQAGADPTVVMLPGFNSDMTGSKAEHLATWCAARGQAFLRFDYSGHGQSGGAFTDGDIGRWLGDALAVIDATTTGKLLLVGSSMGGWIALLVALARPERMTALVGIAPAPDFTEAMMWAAMMPAEREKLWAEGVIMVPNQYGPPIPITRRLIEESRAHLLLHAPIQIEVPVRVLHGQQDPNVPWERSLRLAEHITGHDVHLTLIKDGDHRLSRPRDLVLLARTIGALLHGHDRA